MELSNKHVSILGLGIEGLALYNFLSDKNCLITIRDITDEEKILSKSGDGEMHSQIKGILDNPKIRKIFGPDYLHGIEGDDIIFRSPSVYFLNPELLKAKAAGAVVTSQMQLFFELCPAKIVGVTGTKGKGTTASLIFEMLKRQAEEKEEGSVFLAGNIGYPAITLMPKLTEKDIVVLELSNFQLADMNKSPHVAVITNLGIDHLDYHPNIKEYQDSKKSILRYQTSEDYAVLNKESTLDEEFLTSAKSRKKFFSKHNDSADAYIASSDNGFKVILNKDGKKEIICESRETILVGKHNMENIAAASLASETLGVTLENMSAVAKEFEGLPFRIELVAEIDGVKYINDSFATNPGPTMAAIDSFIENKVMILGGSSKGSDFGELAKTICRSNVKAVVTIGDEGEKIVEELEKVGYKGMVYEAGYTFEDAIKLAKVEAKSGDVVIFSPACASFDMFKNYKDRGNKFKEAVLKLRHE